VEAVAVLATDSIVETVLSHMPPGATSTRESVREVIRRTAAGGLLAVPICFPAARLFFVQNLVTGH